MPYPTEYQRASDHFAQFLEDAKEEAGLGSIHQAYTMIQGVFQVFRRRLEIRDAIRFTGALNACMRAFFIADWDPDETILPFDSVANMNKEVKRLRPDHNVSPPDSIIQVARAVRKNVDEKVFSEVLEGLSPEARDFWKTDE